MGMVPCKPGDEFQVSMTVTGTPLLVAIVRGTGGYSGVYESVDTAVASIDAINKVIGSPGTNSAATFSPARGTHPAYSALAAVWTIRIESWHKYSLCWNGHAILTGTVADNGYIFECGFGMYPTGTGQAVTVSDWVRTRARPKAQSNFLSLAIFGDSLSQPRYDNWANYIKDSLDFTVGVRCWNINNHAVGGDSAAGQYTVMTGSGVSDANVAIILVGTNDIQGQTTLANFKTSINQLIDYCQAAGVLVVIGVPPVFYTQLQAGATGQASVNAEKGAPYRSAIIRAAAEQGVPCVDLTRLMGPIVAHYVNPTPLSPDLRATGDSVVSDNIHPTTLGARIIADAFARSVAALFAGPTSSLYVPPHTMGTASSGWAVALQAPRATITGDGLVHLYGLVNDPGGATHTDGTKVLTLPEYMRPKDVMRFRVLAQNSGDFAQVQVDTLGAVTIYGMASSTYFSLDGISFSIEDREAF
jgi:hypothetical protein